MRSNGRNEKVIIATIHAARCNSRGILQPAKSNLPRDRLERFTTYIIRLYCVRRCPGFSRVRRATKLRRRKTTDLRTTSDMPVVRAKYLRPCNSSQLDSATQIYRKDSTLETRTVVPFQSLDRALSILIRPDRYTDGRYVRTNATRRMREEGSSRTGDPLVINEPHRCIRACKNKRRRWQSRGVHRADAAGDPLA